VERAPSDLSEALAIFNRTVDVTPSPCSMGPLRIRFADSSELSVLPDPNYEAWQLAWSSGRSIMGLPGGGLATWVGLAPTGHS
jgi:hypothetical protein